MYTNKINDYVVRFLITNMGGKQEVLDQYNRSSITNQSRCIYYEGW